MRIVHMCFLYNIHRFKIYIGLDDIMQGLHSCKRDEHHENSRRHMADEGENHHGLGEVCNDNSFLSVLGLQETTTPKRLARERTQILEQ